MSAPPPPPQTQPIEQKTDSSPKQSTGMSVMSIIYSVISAIIGITYCYGAARLSYTKYGSIPWAIVDFIFAPIYYPFYAVFLHNPPPPMMGGRRMKW